MIEPYYRDGTVTLFLGDARDVLPTIEPGINSLVTDPPYGIVNKFGKNTGNGTRTMQFSWDSSEAVGQAIGQAVGKLLDSASAFVFAGFDTCELARESLRAGGFVVKPAAWVKECPPPAGHGNWWPSGFELAMYGYRNSPWFGDDDPKRRNVFVGDSYRHGQPGKLDHPTQKPLWLMRRIVAAIVPPCGTVIDCFAGSGSTLRAAKDTGRKAIGIEINERYAEIAANRLH